MAAAARLSNTGQTMARQRFDKVNSVPLYVYFKTHGNTPIRDRASRSVQPL